MGYDFFLTKWNNHSEEEIIIFQKRIVIRVLIWVDPIVLSQNDKYKKATNLEEENANLITQALLTF